MDLLGGKMKLLAQILLIIMDIVLTVFNLKCKNRVQRMIYQLEVFLIFLTLMIIMCI